MTVELSALDAKRIALTAQGFTTPRPAKPGVAALRKLIKRLHVLQLDPINVCVRAQYMPAFSRLGPYNRADLDKLAYGKRELFEHIGHAASLIETDLHPLVRWRMAAYPEGHRHISPHLEKALAEVAERGALTPSELSFQERIVNDGAWRGSYGKWALSQLNRSGDVAVVGRRGIEQIYDLTERVIPTDILATPTPDVDDAKCELLLRAAQAIGVGTARDLGDYFTMRNVGPLLTRLIGEGRLLAARVEGWRNPAYLFPGAKAKRSTTSAILCPFDSLIWSRERVTRLFGFDYKIEIYVPAPQRKYGYYVYPFLYGEDLVGRVDLKADRKRSTLQVQGAFIEPGTPAQHIAPALAAELRTMATWLDLERIEVAPNGDLAPALGKAA